MLEPFRKMKSKTMFCCPNLHKIQMNCKSLKLLASLKWPIRAVSVEEKNLDSFTSKKNCNIDTTVRCRAMRTTLCSKIVYREFCQFLCFYSPQFFF